MTGEEAHELIAHELGVCEHNGDACLGMLRELLEIAEMRDEETEDGGWSIAELLLDAALPYHPSRACTLAWVTSCGLIAHGDHEDEFWLTERGGELLEWFREQDEAEVAAVRLEDREVN